MSDAPEDPARAWTFDELVREGMSLIPAYAPEWTNHNPSDPGITLLELLAYLSEILAYRALRITPDAKLHFLRLLEGHVASWSDELSGAPSSAIDEAIRARVEALSSMECAVTPADFERLAVDAAATYRVARPDLRAKCMPGMDLRRRLGGRDPVEADVSADVSVVLALERELPDDVAADLCRHVQEALTPCCLLTTRSYVVRAPHLHVYVSCRLTPEPGVPLSVAAAAVDAALRRRFDPTQSDEPLAETSLFGRPLHLSTVAAVIDRAEGVDYVEDVTVLGMSIDGTTEAEESLVGIRIGVVARVGQDTRLGGLASVRMRRLQTDHTGEAETVLVHPWELVHVQLSRNGALGIRDDGLAGGTEGRRRG